MSHEILLRQLELGSQGKGFVLVGVLRTEGSTAIKAGNKALILDDGSIEGWVGGHCTEAEIVSKSLECLKDGTTRFLNLTTCQGGRMDVYLEPYTPKRKLIVFGHVPIAAALSHMAKLLNFHVTVVDKDASKERFPDADVTLTSFDRLEATPSTANQGNTYAVVATMGEFDQDYVARLSGLNFAYIGVVAGKKRASDVFNFLKSRGIPDDIIHKIRAPAGIYIRAVTAEEIALSIMAEVIEVARAKDSRDVREYARKISKSRIRNPIKHNAEENRPAIVLVDPVCGMTVDSSSDYRSRIDDRTIYFCCEACKTSFDSNPAKYLLQQNH